MDPDLIVVAFSNDEYKKKKKNISVFLSFPWKLFFGVSRARSLVVKKRENVKTREKKKKKEERKKEENSDRVVMAILLVHFRMIDPFEKFGGVRLSLYERSNGELF